MQCQSMCMSVRWFEQKLTTFIRPTISASPEAKFQYWGTSHETSAITTTFVGWHLLHQSVLHFRPSPKQQLYLRAVDERLRSSAFAWTLSVSCRNLCVICICCQICMPARRQRETQERERARARERAKERGRVSNRCLHFPLESHRHRSVDTCALCAQLIAQWDSLKDEERNDRHRTYGNLS